MGNCLFPCLYRIYLTSYGRNRHDRQLVDCRNSGVHPHSFFAEKQGVKQFTFGTVRVIPVPFLDDNLGYIVYDTASQKHFVVDCADIAAYEEVRDAYEIVGEPEALFSTHKHWDHAGHNQRFVDAYPDLRVISGVNEPVYASNENLADGQRAEGLLNGCITMEAFETPCHTSAHNMFIMDVLTGDSEVKKMIFTGDCLFEGGVGMFFEGNAAQMFIVFERLFVKVTNPEQCALFFGHDYGWKNYQWAAGEAMGMLHSSSDKSLPWDTKKAVNERFDQLLQLRQSGHYSTGTLLSQEMKTNLFLLGFLQSQGSVEETSFIKWLNDHLPRDTLGSTKEETGTKTIAFLRHWRSQSDREVDRDAAEMRAAQAGKHALSSSRV